MLSLYSIKEKKLKLNCKQAVPIKNTLICKLVTVFMRINAPRALISFLDFLGGWLFEVGDSLRLGAC